MRVIKYFEKARPGASSVSEGALPRTLSAKKARPGATYQEVKQEELQRSKPAQKLRGAHPPFTQEEQRRIVAARDYRIQREAEVRSELLVGAGPILAEIRKLARSKSL